jgi:glycosyltransferase involved in cell wall biosynthesis
LKPTDPFLLSFIIPAHDEESEIAATIRGVRDAASAAGVDYEIIVVDDGSADRTGAVAASAGAQVLRTESRQIAAARNAGAAAARGDILVFVDADTRVHAAVVRAVVETIHNGAVGGGVSVRFDEPTPAWVKVAAPAFAWLMRHARVAYGCFLFCTRRGFDAAGGFDERLFASEEVALSLALRRQGPFTILRDTVLTSGRKFRTYTLPEMLGRVVRLALAGTGALRDRRLLDFWYAQRRKDPR